MNTNTKNTELFMHDLAIMRAYLEHAEMAAIRGNSELADASLLRVGEHIKLARTHSIPQINTTVTPAEYALNGSQH